MQKSEAMPWWVFLAFSSVEKRKTALLIIWFSLLFSFYCIPWGQLLEPSLGVNQLFLIDDWTWAASMFPMTLWYWMSLKWIDNHDGWIEN